MMDLPKEITTLISLTSKGLIWLYIIGFVVLSYLLVSLLTWSFKKPLKYLGIPTIITGILFLIIRFLAPLLLSTVKIEQISIIKTLLPSVLMPILLDGIICIVIGIVMITVYCLLNKNKTQVNS